MTALDDTAWMERSKCSGADPDFFFPGQHESHLVEAAKRFCSTCPVRGACLRYALACSPAVEGIWGGTSRRERIKIKNGKLPLPEYAA
jgi:WhiB family redox-sensing transcriptional regulator